MGPIVASWNESHSETPEVSIGRLPEVASLEAAWGICGDLFVEATSGESLPSDQRLFEEVMFCIVGGFGVEFEHAVSVAQRVLQLGLGDPGWGDERLEARLLEEFARPQFEPQRRDGRLRRYRYGGSKARLIVRARRWLLQQRNLVGRLEAMGCEQERRNVLMECPGLGPKSASWALRNVGLCVDLAILDVHVTRALRLAGRMTTERLPKDYDVVERSFLRWCRDSGAPPGAFDLFLWEWQRGSLEL